MGVRELTILGAGLVGLAVAAFLVQRSARQLARWRRRSDGTDTFMRIAREVDEELELVERRIEAVRTTQIEPAEIVTLLSETIDSLARRGDRVKALALPADAEGARDAFVGDLMLATRALESILDACLDLETTGQAERLERAPTVLKWGHLNLVRAHERLAEGSDRGEVEAAPSLTGPSSPD